MIDHWISQLHDQGAQFTDGRIADFGNPVGELVAATRGPVICDLSHEGLILVSGDDAAAFLHAQLSNDVLALEDGLAQWNGWCSPKGRLLASFLLWKGRQGYFLQLPRALQAAIQKRMQMFVLRSKVTLSDESTAWVRFGVGGEHAESLVQGIATQIPAVAMTTMHFDWGRLIRLSASRFEIVADTQNAIRLWAGLTKAATRSGAPVWDSLAIAEGIPTISPATQDMFVPQMANFELIGGVNFKKGCYPGQEIVARTQYRGILKRRMVHVHSLSSSAPRPGDPVYGKEFGDQPAGMIVNVAPAADCGFDALVVAQIDSIKSGSLSLATTGDNPLTLRSLPYAIPELL